MSSPDEGARKSALTQLQADFEARLALVERDVARKLAPLEVALERYRRALEEEGARKLSLNHRLAKVSDLGISVEVAAEHLWRAVQELVPSVGAALTDLDAERGESPSAATAASSSTTSEASKSSRGAGKGNAAVAGARKSSAQSQTTTLDELFPALLAASEGGKIVLIGSFSGRKKSLPGALDAAAEWIDTAEDGQGAVGNLATRIKRGSVAALVICERVISHKVSEPLVAAARTCRVPIGFAGQGGNAKLAEALKSVEQQLRSEE